MHKTLFKCLFAVMMAAVLASTQVYAFDEGIDYKLLPKAQPTETGARVEVLELFWYGCPHCYHLEPAVDRWLATQPDYVAFRRMPAVLGASWIPLARAYYAAEVMGVLDRVHVPLFEALHKNRRRLGDEAEIADWFAGQGVDREEFLKAYRSFIVDMNVRRAQQFGTRLGLEGVPTFLVNGKFLTSPSMTGGSERMFQVVNHLTAMEAGQLAAVPRAALRRWRVRVGAPTRRGSLCGVGWPKRIARGCGLAVKQHREAALTAQSRIARCRGSPGSMRPMPTSTVVPTIERTIW